MRFGAISVLISISPFSEAASSRSGLAPRKRPQLHRLTQGIDGWIGDLRGIEKYMVPVDPEGLVAAAPGEDHSPRLRLLFEVIQLLAGP